MEMKIMLCGAMVLGGFLWSYLFLRQLVFNFRVASPLIKKMNLLQPDLIGVGAKRYTLISNLVCFLIGAAILFGIIWLFRNKIYYSISFGVGAAAALIFVIMRTKPENKDMLDLFCNAYYQFVPDDELRTILYNKEYKKVKSRLRDMGIRESFLPDVK